MIADNKPVRKNKKLTELGIHRAMFKMIAANGGQFVVQAKSLMHFSPDECIQISHYSDTDTFVFRCIKADPEDNKESNIIIPGKRLLY